jgi:glycosyltransferase involved in cell wall biosynthesis
VPDLPVVGQDPGFGGGALAQMNAFLDAARALGRDPELLYVPHPTFAGRRATLERPDAFRQLLGAHGLSVQIHAPAWVVSTTAPPGYAAKLAGVSYSCWLGTSLADEWAGRSRGLSHARRLAQAANAPTLRRLERTVLRNARRVFATSPWSRDRVAEAAGRDDVGILPLPVDTDEFAPEPDEQWLAREPTIAFVGRADDPRKNVQLLLDAARLLPDVRVRLIGDPPRVALPANVEALGRVKAVPEHLRTAKLLVVPSHQEGFGLLAAEALAAGVPVVTTPCGGPEDLIRESQAGRVLQTFDPEELAATARELLEDVATLTAMRTRGREHVRREHSPERLRELLAPVLEP